MGVKRRNFTRQTDFALISRVFICWRCNFTCSTSMDVFYSPTSKNDRKKYFLRVEVNQKIIFGKTKTLDLMKETDPI